MPCKRQSFDDAPPSPDAPGAPNNVVTMSHENFASLLSTIQQTQAEMCDRVFERLGQLPLPAPSPPAPRPLTPLAPSASEAPAPTGTFATCTSRFTGQGDIEAFVDAVVSFKEAANVPDERAVRGMSMLLVGEAATWWQSVRAEIASWEEALTYLRDAYGDRRSESHIYRELFGTEQREDEKTDLFIARSRALLNKLPPGDVSLKHDKVNGKWQFTCQHGADECYGNKMQSCILKDRSLLDTDKMELVICLMTQANPDKSLDTCLEQVKKQSESDKLKRCASGDQGDTLLATNGDKTDGVQRPLTFVPTIVINERFDQAIQDEAVTNLKAVICRLAPTKPAVC